MTYATYTDDRQILLARLRRCSKVADTLAGYIAQHGPAVDWNYAAAVDATIAETSDLISQSVHGICKALDRAGPPGTASPTIPESARNVLRDGPTTVLCIHCDQPVGVAMLADRRRWLHVDAQTGWPTELYCELPGAPDLNVVAQPPVGVVRQ